MPVMVRPDILRGLLLLCLMLGACQPSAALPGTATPPAVALKPVRLCYTALSGAMTVMWYAYEKGLFAKHGLAPEMSFIAAGPNVSGALLGDRVDFCLDGARSAINSAIAGEDIAVVASLYDRVLFDLVVADHIQKPEDLIGQTLAVGTPNGIKEISARLAMEHLGLAPHTQVEFVSFRDNEEPVMAGAVESGAAAGAILAPPLRSRYREAGLHVLLDISDVEVPFARLTINSTRGYLAANRETGLAFLRAILESIALMQADPPGTQAVMAKYLSLDPLADAPFLAEVYDSYITRHLIELPYPSIPAIETAIGFEVANNPAAADIDADELVDDSLLRELEDSGFIASLRP